MEYRFDLIRLLLSYSKSFSFLFQSLFLALKESRQVTTSGMTSLFPASISGFYFLFFFFHWCKKSGKWNGSIFLSILLGTFNALACNYIWISIGGGLVLSVNPPSHIHPSSSLPPFPYWDFWNALVPVKHVLRVVCGFLGWVFLHEVFS